MAPPAAAAKRPGPTVLPTKERAMFARLIQEYESKLYKTGLKTADTILKKYPDHGETLSMKGLILASLNRRAEGLDVAKQGLRCDLNSFISWHALGILNRIAKNYGESLKCYAQALRIEGGNNINLIRESAYLYMQLRDWPKLVEHRTNLLRMQPHLRMHWAGLAVALHLGGSSEEAVRVLERFESVNRDVPKRSFEQSEMLLFHGFVLHESNRHQEALDFLASKSRDEIVDQKGLQALQGKCLLALGKNEESEKIFTKLLDQNSEDRNHISLWLEAKGVATNASSAKERDQASAAFAALRERYPFSRAIERISLVYASGQEFREKAAKYIRAALEKGIPSIFNDVRTLYGDDEKRKAVEELVEDARQEWTIDDQSPTSLLWALYFLAQHYSYLGDAERAVKHIDSAIAHSPSLPELHQTRGRILKRAGSIVWASQAVEDARQLDGQDRSLNCKAVKYCLRNGDIDEARQKAKLFTKPDVPDPVADLTEMQATWYLIEEARAWRRKGNYAMALKRCNQIDKIYTEIWDDQLDFHSYCTRKFTLRAYVDMIRFEDRLYSHPSYYAAATNAVQLYLELHDKPSLYKSAASNGSVNGEVTDEQRKELKKQKKAEARAAEEAAKKAKNAASAPKQDKKTEDEEETWPPKDDDSDGVEALHGCDPLVDAERFLTVMKQHAAGRIDTWLLSFEHALRSRNWLQATKYIAQAQKMDAEHPGVFLGLIKLQKRLSDLQDAPEPINKSITAVLEPLVPLQSNALESFRAGYAQRNARRADALLASARAVLLIREDEEGAKREVQAILTELAKQAAASVVESGKPDETFKCTLSTLVEAHVLFGECGGNVSPFDTICRNAFARADVFKSKGQMEQEQKEREAEVAAWATDKSNGAQP